MIYKLLNTLFRFAQLIYFKRVEIGGIENIPVNEANLLIANHPSAFMDPVLIGANMSNEIHFLAAKEFMGGPIMTGFLEGKLNMIPIYRPSTIPAEMHKNTDSFNKCYQALNENKSILIFAEGHSETKNWLDPLKTGSARIALETLVRFPNLKNVNIISVGLNYSNPHQFRSTLYLKIGEIIKVTRNNNFNKYDLTSLAYEKLNYSVNGLNKNESYWQSILIQITKLKLDCDLKQEHLLISRLLNELKINKDFNIKIEDKINLLNLELTKEGKTINEFIKFKTSIKISYLTILLLVFFFIPGFIVNFIPIILIIFFVKKKQFKYSFKGSMYFVFGTLFILLWHLVTVVIFSFFLGWISLFLPIGLLLLGWLSLKCRDKLLLCLQTYKVKRVFNNNLNDIYSSLENILDPILMIIKKK
jgi:glycerol-3-phosphate O-acyltransferase/dihydroxyacetone phosphate acyltransferase